MKKNLLSLILLLVLVGCGEKYPYTSDKEKYATVKATFSENKEEADKNFEKVENIFKELEKLEKTGNEKATKEINRWIDIHDELDEARFPYTTTWEKEIITTEMLSDDYTIANTAKDKYYEIKKELEIRKHNGDKSAETELDLWQLKLITINLELISKNENILKVPTSSNSKNIVETPTTNIQEQLENAATNGDKKAEAELKFLKESGFLKDKQ